MLGLAKASTNTDLARQPTIFIFFPQRGTLLKSRHNLLYVHLCSDQRNSLNGSQLNDGTRAQIGSYKFSNNSKRQLMVLGQIFLHYYVQQSLTVTHLHRNHETAASLTAHPTKHPLFFQNPAHVIIPFAKLALVAFNYFPFTAKLSFFLDSPLDGHFSVKASPVISAVHTQYLSKAEGNLAQIVEKSQRNFKIEMCVLKIKKKEYL